MNNRNYIAFAAIAGAIASMPESTTKGTKIQAPKIGWNLYPEYRPMPNYRTSSVFTPRISQKKRRINNRRRQSFPA